MTDFHEQTRRAWDRNADFWDDRMADGNDFQRFLVGPSTERLLALNAGEIVLEAACGNGVMARRLAKQGIRVVAFDFAPTMVEAARRRGTENGLIEYHVTDATDESAIREFGENRFDAVLSNMAIMDISDIEPLFRRAAAVLKPGGRFIFSLCHPCFNHNGTARVIEDSDEGGIVSRHSVKVFRYANAKPGLGVAMVGQPEPQVYFDRTISDIFGACFRAGMIVTGIEEPTFPDAGIESNWNHLNLFREIPAVLAVRVELRHGLS